MRQDYTDLLNELKGVPAEEEKSIPDDVATTKPVSPEKECRASLMENPTWLYAYSRGRRVLHDRDCAHVARISDGNLRTLSEFKANMKVCPVCYRRAILRSGIGDDGGRIQAYERFFDESLVSDDDLYRLIVENKARLKWMSVRVMRVKVREDTWQVVRETVRGRVWYRLWHNNYTQMENGSRCFSKRFHPQMRQPGSLSKVLDRIVTYSWVKHVEKASVGAVAPDAADGDVR